MTENIICCKILWAVRRDLMQICNHSFASAVLHSQNHFHFLSLPNNLWKRLVQTKWWKGIWAGRFYLLCSSAEMSKTVYIDWNGADKGKCWKSRYIFFGLGFRQQQNIRFGFLSFSALLCVSVYCQGQVFHPAPIKQVIYDQKVDNDPNAV